MFEVTPPSGSPIKIHVENVVTWHVVCVSLFYKQTFCWKPYCFLNKLWMWFTANRNIMSDSCCGIHSCPYFMWGILIYVIHIPEISSDLSLGYSRWAHGLMTERLVYLEVPAKITSRLGYVCKYIKCRLKSGWSLQVQTGSNALNLPSTADGAGKVFRQTEGFKKRLRKATHLYI